MIYAPFVENGQDAAGAAIWQFVDKKISSFQSRCRRPI